VGAGHGWFGNGDSPDDLARHLSGLEKAAAETDRPASLGRLEVSFMPLFPVSTEDARRYADLGADRLVVFGFTARTAAEAARLLEQHADLPR
jgi:alkanesulfonate monooxygenase SsuD/methylene tetrahydromethanopterin reductase-like flavin-dependent oxidoreductase (luciferase family)